MSSWGQRGVRVRFGFLSLAIRGFGVVGVGFGSEGFICHLMTLSFWGKSWSARDCSEFICFLLS
jgi:hypothetical protein